MATYAEVPAIPGNVATIATFITAEQHAENGGDFYPCGSMVRVGWKFDGNTFSPQAETIPTTPAVVPSED